MRGEDLLSEESKKKLYKYIYKPRKLEPLDHIGLHATQHKIHAHFSEVLYFIEPFQSK